METVKIEMIELVEMRGQRAKSFLKNALNMQEVEGMFSGMTQLFRPDKTCKNGYRFYNTGLISFKKIYELDLKNTVLMHAI